MAGAIRSALLRAAVCCLLASLCVDVIRANSMDSFAELMGVSNQSNLTNATLYAVPDVCTIYSDWMVVYRLSSSMKPSLCLDLYVC